VSSASWWGVVALAKEIRDRHEALPERRPFLSPFEVYRLEIECKIIEPSKKAPEFMDTTNVIGFAAQFVAEGKTQIVKAALEDFGVSRVSNLPEEDFESFVQRLQAYDDFSM
jgi:hypothetical protein